MTSDQLVALRAEILERVSSQILAGRDTHAIAAALSEGRTRPTMREIGNGLVLETLGLEAGNTVLDIVHTEQSLRYVRPLLEQGRLVASSNLVYMWLQGLVAANILTVEQAEAVTALGYEAAPVAEFDVRCALIGPNGEWLI